jgi:hypothetical protein
MVGPFFENFTEKYGAENLEIQKLSILSKIWAEFGLYGEVGISANHGPMIC